MQRQKVEFTEDYNDIAKGHVTKPLTQQQADYFVKLKVAKVVPDETKSKEVFRKFNFEPQSYKRDAANRRTKKVIPHGVKRLAEIEEMRKERASRKRK